MDALETLVRDALAEHAAEAPAPDRLLAGPHSAERTGRRWPYALAAAAAVAAVAVSAVLLRSGASHSSGPATPPTFAPIPPGMNEVSYHGITIQVPDNLPVGPAAVCQPAGVRTYDPHAPQVSCARVPPSSGDGGTIVDLRPIALKLGNPRGQRPNQELDLPGPGVSVYVEAPTREQVRTIIASVRVTPIDRNGCAATRPALRNPAAATLLPGNPTAAGECVYTYVASGPAFLLQSGRVDPDRLRRLTTAIQGLPAGAGVPDAAFSHVTRYVFDFADGSERTIEVRYGHPPTVTDGQHVAHDPDNSIAGAFD
jgi:hypothetical protein